MACVLFAPSLATLYSDGVTVEVTSFGFKQTAQQDPDATVNFVDGQYVVRTPHMGVLFVISALLPLITILLFRRRQLQIRLCVVEMLLLLGSQAMIVMYILQARSAVKQLTSHSLAFSLADVAPLAAMVFVWLAIRGIMKDDILVRSLDRIR